MNLAFALFDQKSIQYLKSSISLMQFRQYAFLPTFSDSFANVRFMLKKINSFIMEQKYDETKIDHQIPINEDLNPLLLIGNNQDVIDNYDTHKYIISENFIKDLYTLKLRKFPLETCKQRISLCLYQHNIVLSQMNSNEFQFYYKNIQLLGGEILTNITTDVTFVISNSSLSEKVFEARNNHIPIVSSTWLDIVINSFKLPDISQHLLPRFQGCIFSSTDLLPNAMTKLKQIVVDNGGKWMNTFDTTKTTFLLSSHLSNTNKIFLALKHSIPIIRPEWVFTESSPYDYILNKWSFFSYPHELRIFTGMVFGIEKRCENVQLLQDCILAHGGQIGKNATHLVVTNGFNKQIKNVIQVTANWIWTCAENKKIVDVNESILYHPLKHSTPIKSLSGITFYLHGFESAKDNTIRNDLANMIRLCGGIVFYKNHKSVNYIVSNKSIPNNQFNVPIVSTRFVYEMTIHGKLPNASAFCLPNNHSKVNDHKLSNLKKEKRKIDSCIHSDSFLESLITFTQDPVSSPIVEYQDCITYEDTPIKLQFSKNFGAEDPLIKLINDI